MQHYEIRQWVTGTYRYGIIVTRLMYAPRTHIKFRANSRVHVHTCVLRGYVKKRLLENGYK